MTARGRVVLVALAGAGGQGILSTARILGEAGHRMGLRVSVSELHGMSQRGGAVQAFVRFGTDEILAPGMSRADVLVGFELIETARQAAALGPESLLLANRWVLVPPSARLSGAPVPTAPALEEQLRARTPTARFLDATATALRLGAPSAVNAVLLGAFSTLNACPVGAETLLEALHEIAPPAARDANARAFDLGVRAFA